MVALVAALKLRLLTRDLTRTRRRGLVLGITYALGLAAAVLVAVILAALRPAPTGVVGPVVVLVGAVILLTWVMLPLLVTGVDDSLSPSRFALLPVRAARLLPGLLAAGLLGIGPLCTAVLSLGLVLAWGRRPLAAMAAVVAGVLALLTGCVLPKVVAAAFSQALGSRRYRDLAGVVLALAGVALTLLLQGVTARLSAAVGTEGGAAVLGALESIMRVLAWTPLGWAWAIPWDIAEGRTAAALTHLLLSLALLAGLLVLWQRFLARALTSPLESSGGGGEVRSPAWIDRFFGSSPVGAVAARLLRYYRRDPRRLLAYVTMAALPLVIGATAMISTLAGTSSASLLYVAPLAGLVLGPTVAFDLSYDGTALWLHLATGLRGWMDRLGRALTFLLLMTPLLAVVVVVVVLTLGVVHLVPLAAASLTTMLCSLGVGSLVGAVVQVEVPPPGANPFGKGAGGGLASVLAAAVTVTVSALLSAPAVVVAVLAYTEPWAYAVAVPVALVTGGLVLAGGVVAGGSRLDRQWPEVLRAVTYQRA